MATQRPSVRRAQRQLPAGFAGYIVTWDADSRNPGQCARLRRFVFRQTIRRAGKVYRYPGFVERDGVRYLGQSVVFVAAGELSPLRSFLLGAGVEHVVTPATLGHVSPVEETDPAETPNGIDGVRSTG